MNNVIVQGLNQMLQRRRWSICLLTYKAPPSIDHTWSTGDLYALFEYRLYHQLSKMGIFLRKFTRLKPLFKAEISYAYVHSNVN